MGASGKHFDRDGLCRKGGGSPEAQPASSLPRPARRPRSHEAILLAILLLLARRARAQFLSDLAPDRPLAIEDARPVSYRALSGAIDWTYSLRKGSLNDYGPGFSLLYGPLRGLETGVAIRWVTRPGRNADRGIASGDLDLHALYQIADETGTRPAVAARVGVQLPTGLDSKGTDLHLAALATRSFDAFRLHANLRYTRLGATNTLERRDRYEGAVGVDFLPNPRGTTDTIVLADAVVRSNPVLGGTTIMLLELGARRRIGPQTLLFAGAGTEITGLPDRARLRLRLGLTHLY
ncbi:MAG: hypothetical protein M3R34_06000 [Acidobacteriota bacterium]|nr:hypothetical protein [Acidobacteriota bacterium]